MSLADTYQSKISTEVNPRYLQTPDAQVDLVSRMQPDHYSRRLKGKDKPWQLSENPPTEDTPYWQGHRVPAQLHEKPFNSYGAPGKYVDERPPEAVERASAGLYRCDSGRRIYTLDPKWNREMKRKHFEKADQMYNLKPKSELHVIKCLPDRWPSENKAENWAGVATKSLEAELGAPSRTKYGLYTGRFDKSGTKARQWILQTGLAGGRINVDENNRFPELVEDDPYPKPGGPPPRPRWGYVHKATDQAIKDARATAAAQRNFDMSRPRNTWSCPEMGFHWTHR